MKPDRLAHTLIILQSQSLYTSSNVRPRSGHVGQWRAGGGTVVTGRLTGGGGH